MVEKRNYTIQFRKDTGQQWRSWNPVLGNGEPGYDTTANRFKVGDGRTAWRDLSYHAGDAYQVAQDAGFSGTRQQWLETLRGPKGDRGAKGDDGISVLFELQDDGEGNYSLMRGGAYIYVDDDGEGNYRIGAGPA